MVSRNEAWEKFDNAVWKVGSGGAGDRVYKR